MSLQVGHLLWKTKNCDTSTLTIYLRFSPFVQSKFPQMIYIREIWKSSKLFNQKKWKCFSWSFEQLFIKNNTICIKVGCFKNESTKASRGFTPWPTSRVSPGLTGKERFTVCFQTSTWSWHTYVYGLCSLLF